MTIILNSLSDKLLLFVSLSFFFSEVLSLFFHWKEKVPPDSCLTGTYPEISQCSFSYDPGVFQVAVSGMRLRVSL